MPNTPHTQGEGASPLTLLAVLAHPDDETFGTGGTLALYARRGVQVHLVCATRGEAGEIEPEHLQGFTTIAERRESELRCAAGILGLAGVYFLDYRDSGMAGSSDNQHPQALAAQPVARVAEKIVHFIRLLRPQVVITFDPIGGYKHPDHIAIHRATVQAFHLAGDPACPGDLPPYSPQKLYYYTTSKGWLRFYISVLPLIGRDPRRMGRNQDINLAAIVEEGNFPEHARIKVAAVAREKEQAAACHASQLGGAIPRKGFLFLLRGLFAQSEHYMRAYPPAPPGLRERDLFEGVNNSRPEAVQKEPKEGN
ncbi:MAG: PIG-L family deacetylase [Anaerolineales bacterium]|nr:PIG-L family deacetylase [Anaerolineales bacterium]